MTGSVTSSGLRRFGLAFSAASAFLVIASSPALACNPFELLFGACRETQVFRPESPAYYEPAIRHAAPVHAERPKARAAVARSAPTNSNGVSGKQKPIVASAGAPVGSLALFEKDRTLRLGDVVVTTTGFRVYEGRGAFAPIAHDGSRLAILEKVSFDRKTTAGIVAKAAENAPAAESVAAKTLEDARTPDETSVVPLRPSPVGLRTQARAASAGRIVASGG